MPDLIPAVDDAQRLALETLYGVFRDTHACCREADTDIACLLACVRFVIRIRRQARPSSPQSVVEPTLRFADLIEPANRSSARTPSSTAFCSCSS